MRMDFDEHQSMVAIIDEHALSYTRPESTGIDDIVVSALFALSMTVWIGLCVFAAAVLAPAVWISKVIAKFR